MGPCKQRCHEVSSISHTRRDCQTDSRSTPRLKPGSAPLASGRSCRGCQLHHKPPHCPAGLTTAWGVQFKTAEVASRSSGLVRVNLYKEEVANTGRLPTIPGQAALLAKLSAPYHALRRGCDKSRGKAIYALPAAQLAAAAEFLQVLPHPLQSAQPGCWPLLCPGRAAPQHGLPGTGSVTLVCSLQHEAASVQVLHRHLEGLCADIGKHICTDVQTSERVSVLMKETFVASRESPKDREFMKEFVDTQMFTVYSDCIIK